MKKIAIMFMVAVIAPSLVLAWLSFRSVRDQQIVAAQQQTLLYQGVADALAKEVRDYIADRQRDFAQIVEALRGKHSSAELGAHFDRLLRESCAFAEVGFTVTGDGSVLSPSLFERAEARQFRLNNDRFLGSCESVQVYWSTKSPPETGKIDLTGPDFGTKLKLPSDLPAAPKVSAAPAEFKQLVGDAYEGVAARFLENTLKVLLWYRSGREPDLVYGVQVNLAKVVDGLQPLIHAPAPVKQDVAVALVNDTDHVVAGEGRAGRAFVTSEVGHALPHWKVAVYLLNTEALTRSVRVLKLTLTLIVLVMLSAIALGSALIVTDLRRQLTIARQKTDFVSNVSHELKTPLTSIRMFSELLSAGKVKDDTQRQQFLQVIVTEAARLTRLINNVLDFARMERGETKYHFEQFDLREVAECTVAGFKPHLENTGFRLTVETPPHPVVVRGDRDALAQVLVNLLSNAEKYSGQGRDISVALSSGRGAAEIAVSDRGPGVPRGCEEKIFEQFFRAHDSLSSGIHGSGLGLTLARQIARAHSGDIQYAARPGGGSIFRVTLPLAASA